MRRVLRSALLTCALVVLARPALAQSPGYTEGKTREGQSVSFDDDPMGALTDNPVGLQIGGFHQPKRFQLLRPRETFVPELLKSVEKM